MTPAKIALVAAGKTDAIIPEYIVRYLPDWFGAIFLVVLLSAAMSTLSSQFHTIGTAAGRDLYEKTFKRKGNSVYVIRIGILVGILLSAVLAFLFEIPRQGHGDHRNRHIAVFLACVRRLSFRLTSALCSSGKSPLWR